MANTKIKWKGGRYGRLPHIDVGGFRYFIQDEKIDNKWKYRLYRKRNIIHKKLHIPKGAEGFKKTNYGEIVFLRWYKLKHKYPPIKTSIRTDYKTIVYVDVTHQFMYCVNNEEIKIVDTGVPLNWFCNTMAEAKKEAEPIIIKAIEEYETENQLQIQLQLDI